MKDKSKFLLVKSSVGSGLGDRIRAVLSAILYAKQSGRSLEVMWDDGLYGLEGFNIFPALFSLRDVGMSLFSADNDYSTRPALWRGQLQNPMKILYSEHGPKQWNRRAAIEQFSFDQSRLDYGEEVLVMWEFDQFGACLKDGKEGNLATWNSRDFVSNLAKEHLVLAVDIRELVDQFRASYFRVSMIGVHIRNSDEPECQVKLVSERRYHDFIGKIRQRDPQAGIFLATDNISVQERFRRRYGDKLVVTDKWLGETGEGLHISGGGKDQLENVKEALVDMFLLAACDYLVFPGWSSFSLCSSYFSDAADTDIYPLTTSGGVRGRLARWREFLLGKW